MKPIQQQAQEYAEKKYPMPDKSDFIDEYNYKIEKKINDSNIKICVEIFLAGAAAQKEREREYAMGFFDWAENEVHFTLREGVHIMLKTGFKVTTAELLSLYDNHLLSLNKENR